MATYQIPCKSVENLGQKLAQNFVIVHTAVTAMKADGIQTGIKPIQW